VRLKKSAAAKALVAIADAAAQRSGSDRLPQRLLVQAFNHRESLVAVAR